jgi:hypothetical protein
MTKYAIFNPNDYSHIGLARTDEAKDKFLIMWSGRHAVTITDTQFDKLKRKLATVTFDGSAMNYIEINPLPAKTFTKEELVEEISKIYGYIQGFNVNNKNDLSFQYEQKMETFYWRVNKAEDISTEFPGINESYSFSNWYFNQKDLPDFSDLEIY